MEKLSSFTSQDSRRLVLLSVLIALYFFCSMMTPPEGLTVTGWKSLLLMICAVVLWVSELLPLAVASCLLLFLPQALSIDTTNYVLQNFAISTIFFIFSALIIAKVFVDIGLGYRISLYVTPLLGSRSDKVLLSIMLCGCMISTVLVDIPTAIILAGIAYPLLEKNKCKPGESNYGKSVMIGIPIAAAIGGIATPAGSGLNILTVNLLSKVAKVDISFFQWTAIGLPMALILIFVAWFVICKVYPSEIEHLEGLDDVRRQREELGPLTSDEKKFAIIFIGVLVLWFTQPITKFETALSSLLGSSLFFLPGINLMTWKRVQTSISWESLMLVGSSAALAMVLSHQGAAAWLSNTCLSGLAGSSLVVLLMVITAFGIFSHLLVPVANAVLSLCIPIVTVLATTIGVNPIYLALPLGFTASAVFILPLDPIPLTTYNYGYWKLSEMAKPGLIISIIWIPVCALLMLAGISLKII